MSSTVTISITPNKILIEGKNGAVEFDNIISSDRMIIHDFDQTESLFREALQRVTGRISLLLDILRPIIQVTAFATGFPPKFPKSKSGL